MHLANYTVNRHSVSIRLSCHIEILTKGDGFCEAGRRVVVNAIGIDHDVNGHEVLTHITVHHDSLWDIYADSGVEDALSRHIGFSLRFTERGMQADECASMEPHLSQ